MDEVFKIVQELGYLALAITLAGSYVAATPRLSLDLTQYLPEYGERRKQLLNIKVTKHVYRYGESVLSTWETSFSALARQSPVASRLLTLLTFLNFDDIFLDLFGTDSSSREATETKTGAGRPQWQMFVSPRLLWIDTPSSRHSRYFKPTHWCSGGRIKVRTRCTNWCTRGHVTDSVSIKNES